MMDFSTMGKVCTGVDDDHLDTFNSRLNNMVMDVGEHLRGRPQLMKKIKLWIWRWGELWEREFQVYVFISMVRRNMSWITDIILKERIIQGNRLIHQYCNRFQWSFDNNLKTYWYINASRKQVIIQNQRWKKNQFHFHSERQKIKYWKTQILGKHRGTCRYSSRKNRVVYDDIKWYACQILGHYADQCQEKWERSLSRWA